MPGKEEKKDQEINYEDENNESLASDAKDKIEKLKDKLEHCQKEKHDYLSGWQREKADFINYKRRQEEQMSDWAKMLGEGLVRDILPVLDSLEPRNWAEHDAEKRGKEITNGLKMIREQLVKVLKKHGLEEIKAVGEKFNHDFYEAIEQVDGKESGIVVEEAQKGYLLNGKVLRTAKVKVIK
jgi:molecular chaperone GrpE